MHGLAYGKLHKYVHFTLYHQDLRNLAGNDYELHEDDTIMSQHVQAA